MSVGVNQLLLAMCYYILGYVLVEARKRCGDRLRRHVVHLCGSCGLGHFCQVFVLVNGLASMSSHKGSFWDSNRA